ncbi:MAG TPA: right-handed parallel beta-helix repeat-containing protein [Thermoanaerobaculia bacterium]|nr:right-handed parallel beta-helix repeat-containing protein [Thermoanaerobaculia bacterium]
MTRRFVLAALLFACTLLAAQPREERSEAQLLPAEPEVRLDGAPFPERANYDPRFGAPKRTFYVDSEAEAPGDGSARKPWTELQAALCRLGPGDRLVVAPRRYAGTFKISGACRDGMPGAPIQLFAQDAFLVPDGNGDVLTLERAHWQLWHVQIALGHSTGSGLVLRGAGAHHVDVDHAHISEGSAAAVRVAAGASDVVVSNSHIHHGGGIAVEASTRVKLVNNHIHHNRTAGVTLREARDADLTGNRIHNDAGPAVDVAAANAIRLTANRLWNCSPDAILLRDGSRVVTIERNAIVEATTAIDVRDAKGVVIRRNYLENALTSGSTALLLGGAGDIRFHNNTVNRYAEPVRAAPTARVSFANNLIFAPADGWKPSPADVFSFMGPNAVEAAPLAVREIGRIENVKTIDAGKAMPGETFLGKAPDLGVGER